LNIEQLKRYAVALAGEYSIDPRPGSNRLLSRLLENESILFAAYDLITEAATRGDRVVLGEAWLLDNFFLIEQQITQVQKHLPRRYSYQLPRLANGASAGLPRIYDLALQLISHMDARIERKNVIQFIEAYQTVEPLNLGELWAFPIMLQLALLENLRRVALRIARRREEIVQAADWTDQILAIIENKPDQLVSLLAKLGSSDIPLTASFVEEFHARLQIQGPAMMIVQGWIEQKLQEQGVTITQILENATRAAAANQISIANSIGSLRFINAMDWREYVEQLSAVEAVLRKDPVGMHAQQDFLTRDRYRHAVEEIAKKSIYDEITVARKAIDLAKAAQANFGNQSRNAHVGYWLIDKGRPVLEQALQSQPSFKQRLMRLPQRTNLMLYLTAIFLLTLTVTGLILSSFEELTLTDWRLWFLGMIGFIAASTMSVSIINLFITLFYPPRALARLDFSEGIPAEHRTMVVVPTLLRSLKGIDDLIAALEIRYLGNRDTNLFFALLTDFHDAPQATQPEDETLLAYARKAIEKLNADYADDRSCIFYLFHRPRVWNPHEKTWMGYERKRGKLEQFNALLRGDNKDAFSEIVGDTSILQSIQYVITLDTDTQLPHDAAHALVGNIAHPLNRPIYDAALGRIVEGYAILQPRVSISLLSANQSLFTQLYAGEAGIDPYTREVSDVYQDVFGEGSFVGKGIYHVDAFREAVDGRFPENLILSHDLLEGGYARSALVSDVILVEEHPISYTMEMSRRHRWIRGDWQLLNWLLPKINEPDSKDFTRTRKIDNPLSELSIWKLFDNLRRSLISPALLVLLTGAWLFGPEPAVFWLLWVIALLIFPVLIQTITAMLRKPSECDWWVYIHLAGKLTRTPLTHALLTLIMLPYDALITFTAIMHSAVRMQFTRRGLMMWYLPSYARRNDSRSLLSFFREMWFAPAFAFILGWLLWREPTVDLIVTLPILAAWILSPGVAWWLSQAIPAQSSNLNEDQQLFLRMSARRTWRFFDQFVTAQENWLPPDNFQEYPSPVIASRTSPTNIGMSLLANLSAYDFGYIPISALLQRTEHTLASMEKLERYSGHFYNWYDTRTLMPLLPKYVSSVDSGNLQGCLLTLQAGLEELKLQTIFPSQALQGIGDILNILTEIIVNISPDSTIADKVRTLHHQLIEFTTPYNQATTNSFYIAQFLEELLQESRSLAEILPVDIDQNSELFYWTQALTHQIDLFRVDLARLICDSTESISVATLKHLSQAANVINIGAEQRAKIQASHQEARKRIEWIDALIERCRKLAIMDYEFLYDRSRDLLAIGYDVGEHRRDQSYYDLLASEARLTSFLLAAQRKVPQKHWFTLGRLLTSHGKGISLISWSGSMFEYLMPCLIMPNYIDTLLGQTCRTAVLRQIEYGKQRDVPWGISESCYNLTDKDHIYQYRAFGVPGLGLKRGLGDDLVIAPYATTLALMILPKESCENLQRMHSNGFQGVYGFYESVDYTPSRILRGKKRAIVRTFMAHHQGMSLLSFAHVLLGQPMQRRFMTDPQIKAAELLLHERVPHQTATLHPHAAEVSAAARPAVLESNNIVRTFINPNTPMPEVHLISNGQYHVMVTHAGGGYSRWQELALTRWREDMTTDAWGTFIYLRDLDSGLYWSAAYQPTTRAAEYYEAILVQAKAEYRRRDKGIETHTEITVSPEHNVEIRRVTLCNHSPETRRIELTSYAEVVLTTLNADLAHRAFSNLFVQTEIVSELRAILCTRRPRMPGEKNPWMFQLLTLPSVITEDSFFETDRARFIGRGRTIANPIALDAMSSHCGLSNTDGPVLDPIMAIRHCLTLPSNESISVQIVCGIAPSREEALMMIENYRERHFVERAFEMAWFHNQEEMRHLNMTEADAQIYNNFAASIIYSSIYRRAPADIIARNQIGQAGLWRFSISGDIPIVLVKIANQNHIDLIKQTLQAHAHWRSKGLAVDLVILNEDFSGYRAALQDQIIGLINVVGNVQLIDKPGGIFVRRVEELNEEERVLLQTVARLVFSDSSETLVQLQERRVSPKRTSDFIEQRAFSSLSEPNYAFTPRDLVFNNGLGGFTADGREYIITLNAGQNTPMPWVNVIASPFIGTVISESGSSYTWAENAHEYRLTTWHNDPISDSSGEALYIRDEESGDFWSSTPLPVRGQLPYICRHGFGYSAFEYAQAGILSEVYVYVSMHASIKFAKIKLRNLTQRKRRISVSGYWELVLGEWRHSNLMHIVTEKDAETGALFAHNPYSREYSKRLVFAHVSEQNPSISGNRTEFIGRNHSLANPMAMRRKGLSGKTGAGFDPCAAIQAVIELSAEQEKEIVFIFGSTNSADEARQLIRQYGNPQGAQQALQQVWEFWNHTLGAVYVETPDAALNILSNGWLIYQTLSCRFWGRSGYYQSGGAYGFRDQLQDSMALMHATPWLTREQIIRCAGRQFAKGDVQHWWHPPNGQGVRTMFSDDYLWLPYVTCHYVSATGDLAILDEHIHFLDGRELYPSEEAYYDHPQISTQSGSLYEHCARAIKHGLRFGEHELPLMGCGDWNDGMNLVGHDGKGESVWLAWFLYQNLKLFSILASEHGDQSFADECTQHAEKLLGNIEKHAWDGEWYRRAYFDDGTPLGSKENEECRIDSISQSWSVLTHAGDPIRARKSMNAVDKHLVRREEKLIQLLHPPFDKSALEPGYIKGYLPGIRENGGQYTHAAIWTAMAFAEMGDNKKAWELFALLNPINHSIKPEDTQHYKVEPYVMCADIYGAEPHTGRGGWTWYTGAAGWMYRLSIETLLGLHLEIDHLRITPRVPLNWESYKVHYRFKNTYYHITIRPNSKELINKSQKITVVLDNIEILQDKPNGNESVPFEARFPLVDDQQNHQVDVLYG